MKILYNLAKCRHMRKITQKELSRRSGVSVAMISFIEHEKRTPTLYVIVCLAKALNVKIDDIVVVQDKYNYFRS